MPYEDNDWHDSPAVWEERRLRARKRYGCDECGGTIEPGMTYGRAKAVYDGDWHTWRRCPSCMILSEMVGTLMGECPLWGGLDESVRHANEVGDFVSYDEGRDEFTGELPDPRTYRQVWEAGEEALL